MRVWAANCHVVMLRPQDFEKPGAHLHRHAKRSCKQVSCSVVRPAHIDCNAASETCTRGGTESVGTLHVASACVRVERVRCERVWGVRLAHAAAMAHSQHRSAAVGDLARVRLGQRDGAEDAGDHVLQLHNAERVGEYRVAHRAWEVLE